MKYRCQILPTHMKALALLTGLLIGIGSWGSDHIRIMFHGTVFASDADAVISGSRPATFRMADAHITITSDGQIVHEQFSSSNGAFATILEPGKLYTIYIRQSGYLTRSVSIDTNLIPEANELTVYKIYGDMALISTPEHLTDEHFVGLPMARAEYSVLNQRLEWDKVHSRTAFETVLPTLKGEDGLATREP